MSTRPICQGGQHGGHISQLPAFRRAMAANRGFAAVQWTTGWAMEGPSPHDRRDPLGVVGRRPLAERSCGVWTLAERLRSFPLVDATRRVGPYPAAVASADDEQR